ncbi:MAG: DEAD/DEAH box helicase, partial [Actinomycetota bacterium]
PSGWDAWRLGPLDPADADMLRRLADSLPPPAHAIPIPGSRPLQMMSPSAAVGAFTGAVADLLPRTAAAVTVAGAAPYAARFPSPVEVAAGWLTELAEADREAAVTLRLAPPSDIEGAFRAELVLTSRTDPSLAVEARELWEAPEVVLARMGDAERALLVGLRRGARVWPPLSRLLDEPAPAEMILSDGEVDQLLGPAVEDLASAGISVLWPKELVTDVTVRPTVTTPSPAAVTGAGLSLESLLEMRWEASVDGEPLTSEEMESLVEAKRPLVRLRGRWVSADPERLARLRDRRQIRAGQALAAALGGELVVDGETVEAEVGGPVAELAGRLRDLGRGRDLSEPAGLTARLRPYQRRGLAWLAEMAELGLGGILADDMGLGKTLQVLALHLRRGGPTLVVCPASLIGNWEREAERFSPEVPVRRYHGAGRTLADLVEGEIVLATYGITRRDGDLREVDWDLVVADEAQAMKNPLARTARALRRLPSSARFALTGTPVENRLSDLWAILDWTTPGLLGPLETFRRQVAVPVERHRDPDATAAFSSLIRPFVLRRRKTDPAIAPELPEKTETDRFVPLSDEQATLYRAVVAEALDEIAESEGISRRGLVLKLLTSLKQICNHPAQYLGQEAPLRGRSGKLDAATELIEVVVDEEDAALVFTQYVAMGRLLERHLAERGMRTAFLHGSVPVGRRQQLVDSFQSGEVDAFVVSLKAGGTGLNLTRATHVIHYDRWWNPAVEDQASDRAWRIGQARAVQVHRMVCEGTVEERVAVVLEQKRELADAVVGGGEGWITELDDGDLAALVALGGEDR